MQLRTITPEMAGVPSGAVLEFLKMLEEYRFCAHSIIMARGRDIFAEVYYAPYRQESLQRIYSISKSFVSVAIGMLAEEGKLTLDDPMITFFPDLAPEAPPELLAGMTIRHMLTMETCTNRQEKWFYRRLRDRREAYFTTPVERLPGTTFCYDSPGSFMLGCVVEQLTGMPFLDYLRSKGLRQAGLSDEARCLRCPGGYSFADSGILCRARDLLVLARFVMEGGVVDGVPVMHSDYLQQAVRRQVCNDEGGFIGPDCHGYGYQVWKTPQDGFAFVGMGDQLVLCDPRTDFVFVLTADNQGASDAARTLILHELYRRIIPALGAAREADPQSAAALADYAAHARLPYLTENVHNPFAHEISGHTWRLDENPMGIRWIRLEMDGDCGTLHYENDQGVKELPFGLGCNAAGLFPQEGYSDAVAGEDAPGNRYPCVASADWPEEHKLRIRVQIIGAYLGNMSIIICFRGDQLGLRMVKHAEAFLDEYQGYANGRREVRA